MTAICEKLKVGLDTRKIIISGLKKNKKNREQRKQTENEIKKISSIINR